MADAAAIVLAGLFAVLLRFEFSLPLDYVRRYFMLAILEIPLRIAVYSLCGLYNRLWRYASVRELIAVVFAVSLGSGLILVAVHVQPFLGFPRSVVVLSWLVNIFSVGGIRFAVRLRQEFRGNGAGHRAGVHQEIRLLIISRCGWRYDTREIDRSSQDDYNVIGFVDDDQQKVGFRMSGVPVGDNSGPRAPCRGAPDRRVVIAIPSLSRQGMRRLVSACKDLKVRLKTLPRLVDLVNGQVTLKSIRDVKLEDLLQRDEIKVDLKKMSGYLKGRVVLVTGAGGSIGSELCRQVCRFAPKQLLLLGRGENSIYEVDLELRQQFEG